MEFRKMVTITRCTRQQKRHWCIEQSYGLCGWGRGWGDLGEWHWNMYNIMYEMRKKKKKESTCQCRRQTRVRSLVWEDPLEESVATDSSILAWGIPWTEELGGLQSIRSQRVGTQLKWLSTKAFRGFICRPKDSVILNVTSWETR